LSEDDEYDEEEDDEYDEEEEEQEEERRPVASFTTYDDGSYSVTRYEYEEEPQCFVATACYGSALDQHVVFLRQFRDTEVMRTRIGKNFMRFFNALYYSFSPSLASFLARHRIPKLVTRYVIVAPTIHLLRLSRYLAKPLSNASPEASVVVTGMIFVLGYALVAWALLLLTYHV
jgi:hypothetical protein